MIICYTTAVEHMDKAHNQIIKIMKIRNEQARDD